MFIGSKEKYRIKHFVGEAHGVVKNNINAVVKHFNSSGMNTES